MPEHKFSFHKNEYGFWEMFVKPTITEPSWEVVQQKWTEIIEFLEDHPDIAYEDISLRSTETCAFCAVYSPLRITTPNDCAGCPVYAHTGRKYCEGTAHDLWQNERLSPLEAAREILAAVQEFIKEE